MGKIITKCPSCDSSALSIVKIECDNCRTKFEGNFDIPALLKLSDTDIRFIYDFVKCSGSLKDMAKQHNISYPTLRSRLNTLINHLEQLEQPTSLQKDEILQRLESGEITAKDAAKMLQALKKDGE